MNKSFLAPIGAVLVVVSAFSFEAQAQPRHRFTVSDIQVCPTSAGVTDPEFDRSTSSMAFIDKQGNIKVAGIRSNGTIASAGCVGTIIDTNATLTLPGFPLKNGPEWAHSQKGAQITYTKLDGDGVPTLAMATKINGRWQPQLLDDGANRGLALATVDASDADARLLYPQVMNDGSWTMMWRESTNAATETAVPVEITPSTGGSPRWVPGLRAITTALPDGQGVYQAVRYWIDTGTTEFLTSDAGSKNEVWMWQAPEFGNAWVFFDVVDDGCLEMFRQNPDGITWTKFNTLCAADFSSFPEIISPEPHVSKGRSYVAMQLSEKKYSPSQIWIAAIDPAKPLVRQVSATTTPEKVRSEPEWMQTSTGLYVYYSEVIDGNHNLFTLRRAATGL